MLYMLLAFLAGVSVIFAIIFNGKLAKEIGLLQSTVINFIVGLIASIIFGIILHDFNLNIKVLSSVPIYYYFAAVIGPVIVCLNNLLIIKISAVYVTILVFLGQITTGIVIDYYQFNIFSSGKVIGGILITIGLIIYITGDQVVNNQSTK